MVDPNTGASMLESDDIIKYLTDTYGDGSVPITLRLGMLTVLMAGLGTIPRRVSMPEEMRAMSLRQHVIMTMLHMLLGMFIFLHH